MQRLAGLLDREVAGARIEIVVYKVPDHRRPSIVEHPLNDSGRNIFVLAVSLEHGAFGVVLHRLRDALVFSGRMRLGIHGLHRVIEDFQIRELPPP